MKKQDMWKSIYFDIMATMNHLGVFVYDSSLHGPGLAILLKRNRIVGSICINGSLAMKSKVFILLHEVGHLTKIVNKKLIIRKRPSSEQVANRFAIRMMREMRLERKYLIQYAHMYNRYNRGSKRNEFVVD
jgi:Zn-dependent peptidase ImmA (M78 family)